MSAEDILVVPGTIQLAKNYGYKGLDIWIRNESIIPEAQVFIGHSLGASFILNSEVSVRKKLILINPLVKRRPFWLHVFNWLRFLFGEGFDTKKAVPIKYWPHTLKQVLRLLPVNVLEQMKKVPAENIVVLKGKDDQYFCDAENAAILTAHHFRVIEVDAGHDWNENMARAVATILADVPKSFQSREF